MLAKLESKENREEPKFKLRYKEKLYLNRPGYSANFKSITRDKRNHQLDGGFQLIKLVDDVPPIAHYRPNFKNVTKRSR